MGSPKGQVEYRMERAAIIYNGGNQYTFRDANGNEGPMAVNSVGTDEITGRHVTRLGNGWTLSINPNNPDVGVIIISPNDREKPATVIRSKGGHAIPAPTSFGIAPQLTASFMAATPSLTPESLGMGRKQFDALMEEQSQWERNQRINLSKENSPLFKAQLKLRADQDKLEMGDSEFAALLKEQSEYMSRAERAAERAMDGETFESTGARTSPLQAALNRVTMSKQPEETGYQLKAPGL